MPAAKTNSGILALLVLGCMIAGCGSPAQNATPLTEAERRKVESESSLTLPSDVVVLLSEDGGGRDASYASYRWLFFSRTGITLTPATVPSPSNYLPSDDVESVRVYIQSMTRDKLPPAKMASSLHWSDGVYDFRGSVLKTEKGDYLTVERFRIRK